MTERLRDCAIGSAIGTECPQPEVLLVCWLSSQRCFYTPNTLPQSQTDTPPQSENRMTFFSCQTFRQGTPQKIPTPLPKKIDNPRNIPVFPVFNGLSLSLLTTVTTVKWSWALKRKMHAVNAMSIKQQTVSFDKFITIFLYSFFAFCVAKVRSCYRLK